MNKDKLKRVLVGIGKDVLIAFVIVCIVMLGLYAYCGIWPPMVVVESGSMQRHNDRSLVGVIDTGDMVFVKIIRGADQLTTYVEGEMEDYSRYGAFGDVVIYRPNGLSVRDDGSTVVPIIHRLVVWIDVNETWVNPDHDGIDFANYTFDVPSLGMYNTTDIIVLRNYGYWKQNVSINLGGLLTYYEYSGKAPHGGYITMGDNNVPYYDQPQVGNYEPVLPEWIVGKAVGEIPWFGLIKLRVTGTQLHGVPKNSWVNLYVTIFLLLFIPFMLDIMAPKYSRWRNEKRADERLGDESVPEPPAEPGDAPPPADPGDKAVK